MGGNIYRIIEEKEGEVIDLGLGFWQQGRRKKGGGRASRARDLHVGFK